MSKETFNNSKETNNTSNDHNNTSNALSDIDSDGLTMDYADISGGLSSSDVCMLTTHDNPYDPFTQFDQWFLFDVERGYDSCSRLARIANFTDDMTQKEIDEETERAIDLIIKYDFTDSYKKVYKKT